MRKYVLALPAVLLLTAAPVHGITGKFVDDFEHPFVGLVVFYDQNGDFSHRCSGALLSPRVFLTAGHCVADVSSARVYFQQDAGANFDPVTEIDPVTGYPEDCFTGPCTTSDELYNFGYPFGFPNTKDIGLVILDQPINLAEYGALATTGSLDVFTNNKGQQSLTLTPSGYGLTYTNPSRTV